MNAELFSFGSDVNACRDTATLQALVELTPSR
jgi:hypothetical protein